MKKKKVLFIDRDGTLIEEPPEDFQVDSLEKLSYIPGVFTWLGQIARELDYELVMVTNQDGLGTDSFPENNFWPAHTKMLEALEKEGIIFSNVLIDKSFPHEQNPGRKPGIAMLTEYLSGGYDLAASFVIGDRMSDVALAGNLGTQGILFSPTVNASEKRLPLCLQTNSWEEIYYYLKGATRSARITRKTNETDILVDLLLDGNRQGNIKTGIGFFDHMLSQVARHSGADIMINVKGDLHIDEHHTIEDTAITLGQAYKQALGDKRGIARYGFAILPMDDALAQVALDFSGRPWLVWQGDFEREKVGDMPTEMVYHFFKSFSDSAACNLNVKVSGHNEHHKIEIIFKAFAHALKAAVFRNPVDTQIPSTKGVL